VTIPEPPRQKLPDPDPIDHVAVEARVIYSSAELQDSDYPVVVMSLPQYENLLKNLAEDARWVAQAKDRLMFYRRDDEEDDASN
jgi:hypothetical protein